MLDHLEVLAGHRNCRPLTDNRVSFFNPRRYSYGLFVGSRAVFARRNKRRPLAGRSWARFTCSATTSMCHWLRCRWLG